MYNEVHKIDSLNLISSEILDVTDTINSEITETIELQTEILELSNRLEVLCDNIELFSSSTKVLDISIEETNVYNELYINNQLVSLPIGAIVPYAGIMGSIPDGWLICNDQTKVSQKEYPELYQLIGEKVPDLTNRFIKGVEISNQFKNKNGGNSKIIISEINLPKIEPRIEGGFRYVVANDNKNFIERDLDYYSYNPTSESVQKFIGNEQPTSIDITPPHIKMMYIIKAL